MFAWEAVTQYLTESGFRRTLASLASAPPGSRLIFTYVRRDFLDGTREYGAAPAREQFAGKRQVWRFGLLPDETAAAPGSRSRLPADKAAESPVLYILLTVWLPAERFTGVQRNSTSRTRSPRPDRNLSAARGPAHHNQRRTDDAYTEFCARAAQNGTSLSVAAACILKGFL